MKLNKVLPGIIIFALLGVLVLWAGKGLFRYSFSQTHDLKRHLVRGYDAVLTIREGHFPLRWAGLTNYECGTPTFNYYYPLLYYLVVIINNFAGSIMLSIKVVSFLSILVGTLFFYLWMREETGDRWASFGSSMLYLYAPYRFSLIYVRGSPEYLSYAILPVVLYFFARTFKAKGNLQFFINAFLAATFGGLLTISHNIVSIFIMPIILVYLIVKFLQNKPLNLTRVLTIVFSYISAFGFGAFFIFPALIEERFTKIGTPIFNYQHHFPSLWQVIFSKWGYGDSAMGTQLDGMSFQLGYAHWIVLVVTLLWFFYILLKSVLGKKIGVKLITTNIWVLIFFVLSILFLYLVLPWSLPVWGKIKILQTVDFPWRLLGICVFTISALFGFWLTKIKVKFFYWPFLVGTVLIAFVGNRNHLLSQPVLESELPFYKSLDNLSISRRSVPAFAENILPPSAKVSCYFNTPIVSSDGKKDKVIFEELKRGSTFGAISLKIDKKKLGGERIILNLSYFPEIYAFSINGQKTSYLDCGGRVCFKIRDLVDGDNLIEWRVGQTRIQRTFNTVTAVFLIFWVGILTYFFLKKESMI